MFVPLLLTGVELSIPCSGSSSATEEYMDFKFVHPNLHFDCHSLVLLKEIFLLWKAYLFSYNLLFHLLPIRVLVYLFGTTSPSREDVIQNLDSFFFFVCARSQRSLPASIWGLKKLPDPHGYLLSHSPVFHLLRLIL